MPYERFSVPQNTTSIDDLNDNLTDYGSERPNIEKFIRSHHSAPAESGMSSMHSPPPPRYRQEVSSREHYGEDNTEHFAHCPCARCKGGMGGMISCPMVFEHISSCPVCQRIYASQSCDYRIYILIIVVLLVLCALLFKKAFLN